MTIRTRCLVSATLVLALPLACAQAPEPPENQPQHNLLRALKPPPLNLPKSDPSPKPPTQQPGDLTDTGVIVLRGDGPFQGSANLSGHLTLRRGRMDLIDDGKRSIQLIYRPPPGLSVPVEGEFNKGELSVLERWTPTGPHRRILVRGDGSLLLSYISVRSEEPIRVDLGQALQLSQHAERSKERPLLSAVEVDVSHQETLVASIPSRKSIRVPTRIGAFIVWVETSHFHASSNSSPDTGPTYSLEAWLARAKE